MCDCLGIQVRKVVDVGYAPRGRCYYCGKHGNMTKDHFIPLSKGGPKGRDNIVPACHDCNNRKGDKSAEEFLKELRNEA